VGGPTSSNPASDESFALAKAWVHNYLTLQEHAFCPKLNKPHMSSLLRKSLGEPGVVTRLIDTGPSDGSQEPIPSSACRSTKWKYVILSHCWGQAQLHRIHNDTHKNRSGNLDRRPDQEKATNYYLRETRTMIAANSNVNFT
jgi:hypothetical protein